MWHVMFLHILYTYSTRAVKQKAYVRTLTACMRSLCSVNYALFDVPLSCTATHFVTDLPRHHTLIVLQLSHTVPPGYLRQVATKRHVTQTPPKTFEAASFPSL